MRGTVGEAAAWRRSRLAPGHVELGEHLPPAGKLGPTQTGHWAGATARGQCPELRAGVGRGKKSLLCRGSTPGDLEFHYRKSSAGRGPADDTALGLDPGVLEAAPSPPTEQSLAHHSPLRSAHEDGLPGDTPGH